MSSLYDIIQEGLLNLKECPNPCTSPNTSRDAQGIPLEVLCSAKERPRMLQAFVKRTVVQASVQNNKSYCRSGVAKKRRLRTSPQLSSQKSRHPEPAVPALEPSLAVRRLVPPKRQIPREVQNQGGLVATFCEKIGEGILHYEGVEQISTKSKKTPQSRIHWGLSHH